MKSVERLFVVALVACTPACQMPVDEGEPSPLADAEDVDGALVENGFCHQAIRGGHSLPDEGELIVGSGKLTWDDPCHGLDLTLSYEPRLPVEPGQSSTGIFATVCGDEGCLLWAEGGLYRTSTGVKYLDVQFLDEDGDLAGSFFATVRSDEDVLPDEQALDFDGQVSWSVP